MGSNTEIFDADINPILEIADNDDLEFLVELITGTFTNFLTIEEAYKLHSPNHVMYADLLAKEICEFGGNSFVNLFRGTGPAYKEIVCDVAYKLGAPYNKEQTIDVIEDSILAVILKSVFEKMSDEEKQDILELMGKKRDYSLTGPALTSAFIAIFRAGGFKSYQLTVIIANAIAKMILGHGLKFTTNTILTKLMSIFTGPLGWILTGIWTSIDLAGPAYRVTVPAVIYIAMLRKKYSNPICSQCNKQVVAGCKFCPECGSEMVD
jgi:uncharacterized protein YaaW (UPF0174 family)